MAQVVTQQQLQLLPEYQERFLKDLLANVYRTEQVPVLDEQGQPVLDEAGQPVTRAVAAGIAATSPLQRTPFLDEAGRLLGAGTVDDVVDRMLGSGWRLRRRRRPEAQPAVTP